jgi:hypothetical protein
MSAQVSREIIRPSICGLKEKSISTRYAEKRWAMNKVALLGVKKWDDDDDDVIHLYYTGEIMKN